MKQTFKKLFGFFPKIHFWKASWKTESFFFTFITMNFL